MWQFVELLLLVVAFIFVSNMVKHIDERNQAARAVVPAPTLPASQSSGGVRRP